MNHNINNKPSSSFEENQQNEKVLLENKSNVADSNGEEGKDENVDCDNNVFAVGGIMRTPEKEKLLIHQARINKNLKLYWMTNSEIV